VRDGKPIVPAPEVFLLPVEGEARFCLFHPPSDPTHPGGAFVYVHPFAEEMNKSRRMAALQSRMLADAGFAVLQMDLYGCGDSAGEFAGATWSRWIDDVIASANWLRERTGRVPALWGLRAGCLLAAQAAERIHEHAGLLFWQPVVSGSQHLQQFLRLRVAGNLAGRGVADRTGTRELREELTRRGVVEVAGYELSAAVASGLDSADLAPVPGASRVSWLEVTGTEPPQLAPASAARIERWRAAGHDVVAEAVTGLAFWQTQEIAECSGLLAATQAAVERLRR
jgi:exosortase A-associated hydrolase 2